MAKNPDTGFDFDATFGPKAEKRVDSSPLPPSEDSASGFRKGSDLDTVSNVGHAIGQLAINIFVPGGGNLIRGITEPIQKSLVVTYVDKEDRERR